MRDLFEGIEEMTPSEMSNGPTNNHSEQKATVSKAKVPRTRRKNPAKPSTKSTTTPVKFSDSNKVRKKRTQRPYPIVPFREAAQIGEAIFKFASGERVRRLTLLEKMKRNPTNSTTRQAITNSGKYGITTGSYSAEYLELTPVGQVACNPESDHRSKLESQFKLAIEQVPPFYKLYESYNSKKLPAHEVMKDTLEAAEFDIENPKECIDLFVVNVKELGLLRTIASSETIIPIEQALEELGQGKPFALSPTAGVAPSDQQGKKTTGSKWDSICFYITPIGDEGSAARKHSDLFLSMLVEPALKDLGLEVIRADKIAEPGMISSNIIEHLKYSRLVIADLSLLNPNVFYEIALRHAVKMPIVQIIQKADKLPFDVGQVKSIVIDNSDIYTFTPKLETYRSEITTVAKSALDDPEHVGNPITVFFPDFWK